MQIPVPHPHSTPIPFKKLREEAAQESAFQHTGHVVLTERGPHLDNSCPWEKWPHFNTPVQMKTFLSVRIKGLVLN